MCGHQSKGHQQTEKNHKEGRLCYWLKLVTLDEVEVDRMLPKLWAIVDHVSHPLHKTLDKLLCCPQATNPFLACHISTMHPFAWCNT